MSLQLEMSLQDAKAVRVKEEPDWENTIRARGLHAEDEVKQEPESEAGAAAGRIVKEVREWTSEEPCGVRAAGEGPKREEDGHAGYLDREVNEKQEWESGSGVSAAAERTGLFIGHTMKEEIVVGPEELHRPKQLLACQARQEPEREEDRQPSNLDCEVKEEQEWESGKVVSAAAERTGFYIGHTVKEEIVVGLKEIHRPKELVVSQARQEPEREEDRQPGYLDCEVKKEREWESGSGVSAVAERTGLYIGHTVKEEIVVGPEELHRTKQLLACQELSEEQEQYEQSVTTSTMNKMSLILQSTPAKERSYKCTHCSYTTDLKENLQDHVRIHYTCVYCNLVFADETSLLVHVNKHSIGKSHKPYKCAHCSFTSASKSNLERHKNTHTGEKPYECADCSFITACENNLQKYKKAHTGEKQFKCAPDSFASEQSDRLNLHARIHTSEKQYKCTHHSYTSAYRNNLEKHTKTHTDEELYKCVHCRFATVHSDSLKVHFRGHKTPYKCAHCSITTAHSVSLKLHTRRHTGEKLYKCAHCSFTTAHSVSLKRHTRRHTGEKPYKCTQCSYASSSQSNLQQHQKTHTGEKPYKCAHCNFATARSVSLKLHTRRHTGEKPYKCTQCSYASSSQNHLQQHQKTHTGEKPYKCAYCNFATARNVTLKLHTRTHTGEKPYKCTQCSYAGSSQSNLKYHQKTHTYDGRLA